MTKITASKGNVKFLFFTYLQICSVLFKLRYLLTVLTTKLSEIRICRYKAWYQLSNIVIYLDMTCLPRADPSLSRYGQGLPMLDPC